MKAVFLDRDGVIDRNRDDYVKSWEEFEFLPGSLDAVRRLTETGYRIVVVTNQSAIGRGILARRAVEDINTAMVDRVRLTGGRIDAVLFCPHRPEDNCNCRKPSPGLLKRAAAWLDLDLAGSFLVGDHIADLEAGRAAGCTNILVLTGRGLEVKDLARTSFGSSLHIVPNLSAAADLIVRFAEAN